MGVSAADIRAMTLGDFLDLLDLWEEVHTPADKRGPPRPTEAHLAALRAAEDRRHR